MRSDKTFIWTLTVAVAGFLFGFDTIVISVFISKIGTSTHWVLATIMMILQLIWVAFFMPETKGKSLEQLQTELSK